MAGQVTALNGAVRARLRAADLVGPDRCVLNGRPFAVGEEVVALRNDHRLGVVNGSRGVIAGIGRHRLDVKLGDGRLVRLPHDYAEAGWYGHAALAATLTGRDLSDAVDAAAVVDWRLRQHQPGVGPGNAQATGPRLAGRTTFLEATPEPAGPVDAEPFLHYARQLAERMDQRVEALQERMVTDPPRWADPLGSRPEDPVIRLEWAERAV